MHVGALALDTYSTSSPIASGTVDHIDGSAVFVAKFLGFSHSGVADSVCTHVPEGVLDRDEPMESCSLGCVAGIGAERCTELRLTGKSV